MLVFRLRRHKNSKKDSRATAAAVPKVIPAIAPLLRPGLLSVLTAAGVAVAFATGIVFILEVLVVCVDDDEDDVEVREVGETVVNEVDVVTRGEVDLVAEVVTDDLKLVSVVVLLSTENGKPSEGYDVVLTAVLVGWTVCPELDPNAAIADAVPVALEYEPTTDMAVSLGNLSVIDSVNVGRKPPTMDAITEACEGEIPNEALDASGTAAADPVGAKPPAKLNVNGKFGVVVGCA